LNPLETYLSEIGDIVATGASVAETSFYPPLSSLLNNVGRALKPRVKCVVHIQNRGAGIPDAGLFAEDQLRRNAVRDMSIGALPARGVVEAKPARDAIEDMAASEQVCRYCERYGQVLVTNFRSFAVVGRDHDTRMKILETFELFASEPDLCHAAQNARRYATGTLTSHFLEFLRRVLLKPSQISTPKDTAELLASYARDARTKADAAPTKDLQSLRSVFEEALGLKFGSSEEIVGGLWFRQFAK
jgi:hypothetical protein